MKSSTGGPGHAAVFVFCCEKVRRPESAREASCIASARAPNATRPSPLAFCTLRTLRCLQYVVAAGAVLLLVTGFDSVSGAISLPPQSTWVCRISETNQRCADVYANTATGEKHGVCREGDCCSRTALSPSFDFGDVCKPKGSSDCRSYKDNYSFGKCDLAHFCGKCSTRSLCKLDSSENGGVYCQCPAPSEGNGLTCKGDPCASAPCANGTCSPRPDDPNDYQCDCYPGFSAVKNANGVVKSCVDVCATNVCGEGALACYSGDAGHICACKEDYVTVTVDGNDTCVMPDLCAVNPCGDSTAVESCVTVSSNEYRCTCKAGHVVKTDRRRSYCARE
ncbi:EGF family domain-containing protein [Toxoplasma gondii VAND]|uniref:EGF family domain-containing protein n=1 Tax=Toxoplasma gondii VAND TaxID=933077 RepID=A0A086PGU7_TOXGO|nr:EGF family domain-containing protein [Toxoplasma gondii VAND]